MKFQRIQDLRVDSDLSQRQLGEILHISQRSYSHYEIANINKIQQWEDQKASEGN